MANAFYITAKDAFQTGGINLLSDNIKAVLVDSATYTPNTTTDQYLQDIPVGARKATTANLSSKTVSGGWFDCANLVFSSVAAGAAIEYIVFYKDTGNEATSQLITIFDTATGLPVTPDGNNINVTIDAQGVWSL